MFYDFDIYKWGLLILPPVLRKNRIYALLSVLLKPLYDLLQVFKTFRSNTLQRININGQVIYMEKALNDRFLLEYHEIYITDTGSEDETSSVLYEDEGNTMIVYEDGSSSVTYLKGLDEGKIHADFVVNVPSFLDDYIDEIKVIIESNKPAGRSYSINIYDYE